MIRFGQKVPPGGSHPRAPALCRFVPNPTPPVRERTQFPVAKDFCWKWGERFDRMPVQTLNRGGGDFRRVHVAGVWAMAESVAPGRQRGLQWRLPDGANTSAPRVRPAASAVRRKTRPAPKSRHQSRRLTQIPGGAKESPVAKSTDKAEKRSVRRRRLRSPTARRRRMVMVARPL